MTFSFDTALIADKGLNQMRFELGDVFVDEPEKTAYLSDEEYLVILETSPTFKRAKLKLIETLLRRFSYEVDSKVDSVEFKLSQRIDEWKDAYNRLKAEVDAEEIAESSALKVGGKSRPPAFWIGQHDWRPRCI